MNAVAELHDDVRTAGVEYFDPDDHLLTTMRRASANAQDLHIEIKDLGSLTQLTSRGECFLQSNDLPRFFSTSPDACKLTILDADDPRIPTTNNIGRNIDEMMWHAAFYASGGRLMRGCYRDDVVELEYWPNLTRLPHTPNAIRIASLLLRHPTSVTLASRLLKVDTAELYQFYSAARAAGFARAVNRTPDEPKLEPHRNQTLLSSLLKKIAGL